MGWSWLGTSLHLEAAEAGFQEGAHCGGLNDHNTRWLVMSPKVWRAFAARSATHAYDFLRHTHQAIHIEEDELTTAELGVWGRLHS